MVLIHQLWGVTDKIRGSTSNQGGGWPVCSHNVDSLSFMGLLQTKTGLIFDLPTEAQWEYACRAGTNTRYNSGKENIAEIARKESNQAEGKGGFTSGTTTVGSYLPNAWGLYDMHGNVNEWCLDWYARYNVNLYENPVGPENGTRRVVRGGGWYGNSGQYRSAYRARLNPGENDNPGYYLSTNYGDLGFRVACHFEKEE